MTVPTFQFALPASQQQPGNSSTAATNTAASANAPPSTTVVLPPMQSLASQSLAESLADSLAKHSLRLSKPASSSSGGSGATGAPAPFSGFTVPAFKPPATATTTLTFDNLSPSGFQDMHALDIRSTGSQSHPRLGNVSLALRTSLAGAHSIDTHVIVGGGGAGSQSAAAASTPLFGTPSTKVSVTVTLHVVYSNEGSGDLIALRGSRLDSDVAAAEKFNNVETTLIATLGVAASSSSTAANGAVYTVTLPHSPVLSPRACAAANLVHIKQAVVTLDCQPDLPGPRVPLFQLPTSTPTPLGLISSLNQPLLCDASILPKDESEPIDVSRAVLACTSPYFRTMFSGNWAESTSASTPITSPYPASVVIPCLVHMYTNWVPAEPMPEAVTGLARKYKVDVKAFDRHMWSDVMDLADMWELNKLVMGANRALVNVLNADHERRSKPAPAGGGGDAGMFGGVRLVTSASPLARAKLSPRR